MKLRRCAVAWLEPREVARFQLDDLMAGGTGVVGRLCWFAHAPHLPAPVEIDAAHVPLLGALGPVDWVERDPLDARFGGAAVEALLDAGLLIAGPDGDAPPPDAEFEAQGWHPPAAVAHMASRWEAIDGPRGMAEAGVATSAGLLREHGPPPPHAMPPRDPGAGVALPRIGHDDFDALLDTRAVCRNYDGEASVPLALFSQLMERVFGARGKGRPAEGFEVYKRTSPSGGALHPTECWLLVQRVEGIDPGLYRYRIDAHALEPVVPRIAPPQPGDAGTRPAASLAERPWTAAEWRAFARIVVAGQDFFAAAPVLCILAPRFRRNFWKYRNHAKAYRVAVLDVGHLSQTLQLCATRAGMGAFVTAAINEVDIERAFGLAPCVDGPLAVCGFGMRAGSLVQPEFDPGGKVWPREGLA